MEWDDDKTIGYFSLFWLVEASTEVDWLRDFICKGLQYSQKLRNRNDDRSGRVRVLALRP